MEIATSQVPRIVRLALIGAGAAFAWIVVSLVLGFGLGQANADEPDDGGALGGALGAVTSLVDATASSVVDTVSTATTGVTGALNSVVAAAPAPVQQPVREVVQAVGTAVTTITQPVTDTVSGGVVGGIAEPVVDLVSEVPIVGGIVSAVGLDEAVTDLGGTVDATLGGLVGAVDDTGAAVGQPPSGDTQLPGLPGLPALPGSWAASSTAVPAALPALTETRAAVLPTATAVGGHRVAASVFATTPPDAVVASSAALIAGGPSGSAGGLCLPTSSAGPGGAGPGAWALAALVPLAAHRAWVRRGGPEDEHAPPAPAGSTDVSPD